MRSDRSAEKMDLATMKKELEKEAGKMK